MPVGQQTATAAWGPRWGAWYFSNAKASGANAETRLRDLSAPFAAAMAWWRLLSWWTALIAISAGVTASDELHDSSGGSAVAMAVYTTIQNDLDSAVFVAWEHERHRRWTVPTGGSVIVRSFDGHKWTAIVDPGLVVAEWIVRIAAGWNQSVRVGTGVPQVDGLLFGDELVREIAAAAAHDRTSAGAHGRLTLTSEALTSEWHNLRFKAIATLESESSVASACAVAAAAVRIYQPRWLAMLVGLAHLRIGLTAEVAASVIGDCVRRLEAVAPAVRFLVFSLPAQECGGHCPQLHVRMADLNLRLRQQLPPASFVALQLGGIRGQRRPESVYVEDDGSLTHVGLRHVPRAMHCTPPCFASRRCTTRRV